MNTNQTTGDLVEDAIRTAERSQAWVADKVGMSAATLRRKIRSGGFTLPELARIAATLGVHPVDLLPANFRQSQPSAA